MFMPTLHCIAAVVMAVTMQLAAAMFYNFNEAETLFEKFIQDFNKNYESEYEKLYRLAIFKDNLRKINKMNSEQQTAVFGITKFTDLSQTEFLDKYTGVKFNKSHGTDGSDCQPRTNGMLGLEAAESWDWREHNAVTAVKDQGECRGCWSFATTGTMEGIYAIAHGTLLSFSEQQQIDCGKYTQGCNGGWPSESLRYLKEVGVVLEKDYPFTGQQGSCQNAPITAHVTGCKDFTAISEDELKSVLTEHGPLSVVMDASTLNNYQNGILLASSCPGNEGSHAVLLVGYGTENGTPYWILKNSWGESFGEEGYFRISRGDNACGIVKFQIVVAEMA